MIWKYIALAAFSLLWATSTAGAAHMKWVEVGRETHETCRCGSHPCGTTWTEGGRLFRCRPANSTPAPHRKHHK